MQGLWKQAPRAFLQNTIANGFIYICLKYKTGTYFISKDKICWSSIFFPENFPSSKKWLFHPFNNNFPHSPLGVLVGNENGLLLKGGNSAALREFKDTSCLLSKLEISDITNTAVDLAAQLSEASSGTPDPRAQQGEMNNSVFCLWCRFTAWKKVKGRVVGMQQLLQIYQNHYKTLFWP